MLQVFYAEICGREFGCKRGSKVARFFYGVAIGISAEYLIAFPQKIHEVSAIPTSGVQHLLPDGSERYLVDEALLVKLTRDLGGQLEDPLKTTIVQNERCMTTWVVRRTR